MRRSGPTGAEGFVVVSKDADFRQLVHSDEEAMLVLDHKPANARD
jgi:hypothetical protein